MSAGSSMVAVAAALAALSFEGTAPAVEGSSAPPEAAANGGYGTRLKLRTPIETYYTSNLLHVQDRRASTFDGHLGPGERFDGMNAVWDLVLRLGARASLEVPTGRKQDVRIGLGADHFTHQQNGIANYFVLSANGEGDLTRHDKLEVGAKLAPHRFRKNHRVPYPVDPLLPADKLSYPFEHAYVREFDVAARYDHEWSHLVATRLEYVFGQAAYDAPFHNRDESLNEGRVALVLDLGHASRLELGGGFGVSTSPGETERSYKYPSADHAVPVDRSFREAVLEARARVAASPVTTLEARLNFRSRDFTTSEHLDLVHYQRSDRLYRIRLGFDRKVGSGLSVGAFAGYARDYSNRSDPSLTPDEAGYGELVLGGALSWRLSTKGEQ